jgi:hypothetical protein
VAVPATFVERRVAAEMLAQRSQQAAQHRQRQASARLRICFAGASDRAQTGHVGTRSVAVQDLQKEQMNGGDRIEHALAPGMPHRLANRSDQFRIEKLGNIALDLPHDSDDTTSHPWPPVGVRS